MNITLTGKPKRSFIIYSTSPHRVGEHVNVLKNGRVVQTGRIVEDMSTVKKYQDAKKRIGSKDVSFNAGKGYYRVEVK